MRCRRSVASLASWERLGVGAVIFAGKRVALGGLVSEPVHECGGGESGFWVVTGVSALLFSWRPAVVAGASGGWCCCLAPLPHARWPRTCWSSQRGGH
eukprot:14563712-Alexandrium_andersonii.AAC.1